MIRDGLYLDQYYIFFRHCSLLMYRMKYVKVLFMVMHVRKLYCGIDAKVK